MAESTRYNFRLLPTPFFPGASSSNRVSQIFRNAVELI